MLYHYGTARTCLPGRITLILVTVHILAGAGYCAFGLEKQVHKDGDLFTLKGLVPPVARRRNTGVLEYALSKISHNPL